MSPAVTAPLKASRLLSAGALTLPLSCCCRRLPSVRTSRPNPRIRHPGPAATWRARLARPPTSPRPSRASPASTARPSEAAERGVPLGRRSPPHRRRSRRARLPQRQPGLSRSLHRGRARGSAGPAPRARPPLRASLVDHRRRRTHHDRRPRRMDRFPGRRRVPHRRRWHRRRGGRARRAARPGGALERGRQRARAAGAPLGGPRRRRPIDAGMDQRRPDDARALALGTRRGR